VDVGVVVEVAAIRQIDGPDALDGVLGAADQTGGYEGELEDQQEGNLLGQAQQKTCPKAGLVSLVFHRYHGPLSSDPDGL
jgi:hypothetical protein